MFLKRIRIILMAILLGFMSTIGFAAEAASKTNQPTVVFAVGEANLPFSSVDSTGRVYGFSISFTQLICQKLQVHCRYTPMTFNDFFGSVKNGKVDAAIGAIAITPSRARDFAFTEPYLPSHAGILAKYHKGQTKILEINPNTVKNKIFGFQDGSVFFDYLHPLFPNMKYKTYKTASGVVDALAQGEIDFAVINKPAANYWINKTQQEFYLVKRPFTMQVGIGIMLSKNNPELLQRLNKAILEITRSPAYANLLSVFFPAAEDN